MNMCSPMCPYQSRQGTGESAPAPERSLPVRRPPRRLQESGDPGSRCPVNILQAASSLPIEVWRNTGELFCSDSETPRHPIRPAAGDAFLGVLYGEEALHDMGSVPPRRSWTGDDRGGGSNDVVGAVRFSVNLTLSWRFVYFSSSLRIGRGF